VSAKGKKLPDPQLELFTAMSFVTIDPKFDRPEFIDLASECINDATTMQRYGMIHTDTVFERVEQFTGKADGQYQMWDLCGVQVMVTPKRLRSFRENISCVECGRRGNVFLIERHVNDKPDHYLNLYCIESGNFVLMTVDHILPDSWFGRYDPANFQTMCRTCNQQKKHTMSVEEINAIRSDIKRYAKAWVSPEYLDALLALQLLIHSEQDQPKRTKLTNILDKYRRCLKHTTKAPEIARWLVDLKREIKETTASFQGVFPWQSTTVDHAVQPDYTGGSWKARTKRWFVSLARGVVGLHPVQLRSPGESQSPEV
jgi:5-methylcytosine-specific restriction endonuclease McrA